MAFMPFRRSPVTMGQFDPDRFGNDETTVFSAAEMTRQKILLLAFSMNEKVSIYLQYKKAGKVMPFANEEAQRSIQELYSLVRESAILWLNERERKIDKSIKSKRKPPEEKIRELTADLNNDRDILEALDLLDNGGNAKDNFLVIAKRFLNKYIYHRGISKLEIENKDPIDDYAKKAYGDEYKDDGEEDGTSPQDLKKDL